MFPPDSTNESRLAFWAQLGSLILTGWIVWLTAIAPRLRRQSLGGIVTEALAYSVFVWIASAVIALGIYLSLPRTTRDQVITGVLRTSTTAVWFAPAMLLMTRSSPIALLASLALVVSTTRLLCTEWNREPPTPHTYPEALAWALGISLCLHFSGVGFLMHIRLLSAPLLVTAAAALTILAISAGAWAGERAPTVPKSILGVVLTIVLSAGLTIGGFTARMRAGAADGFASADPDPAPPATQRAPGDFPGVVLWPEVQKITRLVAPLTGHGIGGKLSHPLQIPFGGEYWMSRWIPGRPPANSYHSRGTPASLSFATTDHAPLFMEARQTFDEPIDLTCCRSVQVEILNADRYPGTVSLELFAIDSRGPRDVPQFLGSAPVKSAPQQKRDPVTPVAETLEFPLSASLTDPMCSQFKLQFQRARARMDKSARISIERFVLVPR